MDGCAKLALWWVRGSVAPAREVYSPPEREVGMVMTGMVAGCTCWVGEWDWASRVRVEREVRVVVLLARAWEGVSEGDEMEVEGGVHECDDFRAVG